MEPRDMLEILGDGLQEYIHDREAWRAKVSKTCKCGHPGWEHYAGISFCYRCPDKGCHEFKESG